MPFNKQTNKQKDNHTHAHIYSFCFDRFGLYTVFLNSFFILSFNLNFSSLIQSILSFFLLFSLYVFFISVSLVISLYYSFSLFNNSQNFFFLYIYFHFLKNSLWSNSVILFHHSFIQWFGIRLGFYFITVTFQPFFFHRFPLKSLNRECIKPIEIYSSVCSQWLPLEKQNWKAKRKKKKKKKEHYSNLAKRFIVHIKIPNIHGNIFSVVLYIHIYKNAFIHIYLHYSEIYFTVFTRTCSCYCCYDVDILHEILRVKSVPVYTFTGL